MAANFIRLKCRAKIFYFDREYIAGVTGIIPVLLSSNAMGLVASA